MLRGQDLNEAERWLATSGEKEPKPTPLQTEYVTSSRSAQTRRRRLALAATGLGVIIAISIGYAALILGFSIEGSELAAILGWGVLRGVLGRTSIVENNINQTIASAVNGASSGIMFSVPALLSSAETKASNRLLTSTCL